jgi:hypothetical protein
MTCEEMTQYGKVFHIGREEVCWKREKKQDECDRYSLSSFFSNDNQDQEEDECDRYSLSSSFYSDVSQDQEEEVILKGTCGRTVDIGEVSDNVRRVVDEVAETVSVEWDDTPKITRRVIKELDDVMKELSEMIEEGRIKGMKQYFLNNLTKARKMMKKTDKLTTFNKKLKSI